MTDDSTISLASIDKSARRTVTLLRIFVIVAAVVGIGVAIPYFLRFYGVVSPRQDTWGQFGDYIGGVLNPILSFFAMIGLLATVRLQHEAMKVSMKELHDANESARRQNFEASFFQLLNLHNEIVNAMEIRAGASPISGRACFTTLVAKLKERLPGDPPTGKHWLDTYMAFSMEHQHQLGHYFRMLYNIVKFIDRAEGIEDKRFYSNLVRGELSDHELSLLFLNCQSKWGIEKFKPLVEKFALLKTMVMTGMPAALIHAYSNDAFGGEYPETSAPV